MTVDELLSLVNLPRFEGFPVKVHTLPPLTPAEFSLVMDPKVVGNTYPEVPMPKHLVFEAKAWFYILSKTDAHAGCPQ